MKPVINIGMCSECGGPMVPTVKGHECENCGNKTIRAK
jgi:exosome complex RNA-binding protein Csl4